MADRSYIRTGTILRKKYTQYMIPAMLSAIGVSLSEFADSMIVGNLIGPEAFAIVNLGLPIVLIASTIYTITGVGGSLLYAEYLGKKDKKNADNCFSASVIFSILIGAAAVGLLLILHSQLSTFFGCPANLKPQFDRYINVLYLFMPAAILLMNFTFFLPVVGLPFLSMGLVVSANILNIGLDVVMIRGFGMGCEGAAAATLISFLIVLAAGILICRIRKVPLKLTRPERPGTHLKMIVLKGLPSGVVQAGYAVTTIFCNSFMNLAFGLIGVEAMSVFGQMDSIISIALIGITENNALFVAMLKSEGDYFGIRSLSRRVTIMIVTVVSVICVLFAVFSGFTAGIFNVHGADALALIGRLTPVYVLYYPLRCIILVLRDIYNTLDRSGYAMFLGIMDKIVCIPLIGGILYAAFGGYGLIAAFPAGMAVILLLIMLINHRIVRRSNGRYSPVLLLDEAYPMKTICSYSTDSLEDISEIALMLEEGIEETERNAAVLNRMCLAAEEMSLYIAEQCGKETPVDFMISHGKDYTLTCRSPGRPFCPIPEQPKEQSPNERLLTALFHIKHEYIFGLNSTSLTIKGGTNEE